MLDFFKKITSQFYPSEFFNAIAEDPRFALIIAGSFGLMFFLIWISPGHKGQRDEQRQREKLSGKVHNICLFISEPSSRAWEHKVKERFLDYLREAEAWLTQQAEAWGVHLEFAPFLCLGINEDIQQKLPKNRHQSQLIDDIINKVEDILIIKQYRAQHNQEPVRILLFANKTARSFAVPWRDATIIYNKPGDIIQLVIAHELLHLYGASDLYQVDKFTKEQAKLASKLYPRDIMSTHEDLKKVKINPFTAFKIGWHQSSMTDLLKRLET